MRNKLVLGSVSALVVAGFIWLSNARRPERGALPRQTEGSDYVEVSTPMPVDEKAAAIGRAFGPGPQPPNIHDVKEVWQSRTDKYIAFLREESFEDGLRRAYIISELATTVGNDNVYWPDDPRIISAYAKTRRFSKLVMTVQATSTDEEKRNIINTLAKHIQLTLAQRKTVTDAIDKLIIEQPVMFTAQATEEQRRKLVDLMQGYGTTSAAVPEGVIPISLEGTQRSLTQFAFLLGLTEHKAAIRPLLYVVDYDDSAFTARLTAAAGGKLRRDLSIANRTVLADAMDRVLTRAAQADGALQLLQDYATWRASVEFPQRTTMKVPPFDSRQIPSDISAQVLGMDAPNPDAKMLTIALPMARASASKPGLGTDQMARIERFAHLYITQEESK